MNEKELLKYKNAILLYFDFCGCLSGDLKENIEEIRDHNQFKGKRFKKIIAIILNTLEKNSDLYHKISSIESFDFLLKSFPEKNIMKTKIKVNQFKLQEKLPNEYSSSSLFVINSPMK